MNLLSTLAFSSQVLGKRYTKINTYSVYASFPFLFTDVKCIIGHIYNIDLPIKVYQSCVTFQDTCQYEAPF